MMLSLSCKLENIQCFILMNNQNYYVSNGRFICENTFDKEVFTTPLNNFVSFNDNFYLSDWNGKYLVFDLKGNSSEEGYGKAFINNSNYYLFYQYMVGATICEGLINKKNETLQLNLNSRNRYVNDSNEKNFFYLDKDIIKSADILDSKTTWSFSLAQHHRIPHKEFANENAPWEIKKFIGVLENKLWVAMNHRTIIALNCETGELVHSVSEIPGFEREWIHNSIPNTECIQLLSEESILLGFADDLIWKINAKTGGISIKSYESIFKENHIKKYRNEFIIDGDLLFFLSDSPSKVGCFNWKTEELVWQYAFEKTENGEYPRLTEIQGNRNKLGVKDLANNLYIFEQE